MFWRFKTDHRCGLAFESSYGTYLHREEKFSRLFRRLWVVGIDFVATDILLS